MGRLAVTSDDGLQYRFICFVAGGHLVLKVEADGATLVWCFLSRIDISVDYGFNLLVDRCNVIVVVGQVLLDSLQFLVYEWPGGAMLGGSVNISRDYTVFAALWAVTLAVQAPHLVGRLAVDAGDVVAVCCVDGDIEEVDIVPYAVFHSIR